MVGMVVVVVLSACGPKAPSGCDATDDPNGATSHRLVPERWGVVARYVARQSVTLADGEGRRRTTAIDNVDMFGACTPGDGCFAFVGRAGDSGQSGAGRRFLYFVPVDHRGTGPVFALVDSIRSDASSTFVTRQGLVLSKRATMRFSGCGRAPTKLETTGLRYGLEIDRASGDVTLARCLRCA
jgi:hypothetical protein